MKKQILIMLMLAIMPNALFAQEDADRKAIEDAIANWYKAWKKKSVELAIQDYAENVDWTNAFGDRVQSKTALKELLTRIFAMDFVMAGKSENLFNDITFLAEDIALVRSKVIRVGQEWSDNSAMDDRHINHLRVFVRENGDWKIVSHMISQAWSKK